MERVVERKVEAEARVAGRGPRDDGAVAGIECLDGEPGAQSDLFVPEACDSSTEYPRRGRGVAATRLRKIRAANLRFRGNASKPSEESEAIRIRVADRNVRTIGARLAFGAAGAAARVLKGEVARCALIAGRGALG